MKMIITKTVGEVYEMLKKYVEYGCCKRRNYAAAYVLIAPDFENKKPIITLGSKVTVASFGVTSIPSSEHCLYNIDTCQYQGCLREEFNIPSGERYELCRSIHAEQMALVNLSHKTTMLPYGMELTNPLYMSEYDNMYPFMLLYGVDKDGNMLPKIEPCSICARLIMNAGVDVLTPHDFTNNEGA